MDDVMLQMQYRKYNLSKSIFLLVLACLLLSSPTVAQHFRVGGGLSYGTVINSPGLDFRGAIALDNTWVIAPHFTYFFNKNKMLSTSKWNALNLDVHYVFKQVNGWYAYPLAGVNIATVSEKVNQITFSNTYVGLNLGGGGAYPLSPDLLTFGEVKYVISDADQAVFTVGFLYKINR